MSSCAEVPGTPFAARRAHSKEFQAFASGQVSQVGNEAKAGRDGPPKGALPHEGGRMTGVVRGVLLLAVVGVGPAWAQGGPDPGQPRPPLLLGASREERLEASVRMYLQEFIGAIQRGDTVALGVLVPAEAIPDAEKPVAARAGCPSLGATTARLQATRAGESQAPVLPLGGIRLRDVAISLNQIGDTTARVQARVSERRGRRVRYAPVEVVFTETGGAWRVVLARGVLTGLCGLAVAQ